MTSLVSEVIIAVLILAHILHVSEGLCDPDIPSRPVPDVTGAQATRTCTAGQEVQGGGCQPCPAGRFMTSGMSERQYGQCIACLVPGKDEVAYEACTATRDTHVTCKSGKFRSRSADQVCQSTCVTCSVCGLGVNLGLNYEKGQCEGYNNTVCCNSDEMVLVGGVCVHPSSVTPSTVTVSTEGVTEGTTNTTPPKNGCCTCTPHYLVFVCNLVLFIIFMTRSYVP
ncbi:tumor necrosis factor receptor superfamily member 10C-like [Physella acuta]|uniref:tumor necrosis factor receptor superfamily member 10C-like n=1 Tax=Physella acuta TaxID=109671 RepID=UPI0027DDE66B|nr:tumor necrosis factor receptor superfamily member 10C-like [Physella acuta]